MIPTVCIIILNWNGWQDTVDCLRSLREITYPEYHIILIDNGSTDESILEITPHLASRVHFVCNRENVGFARACNQGMNYAISDMSADFILLLNNDTVVDPNFLSEMVNYTSVPSVGMVQPLMLNQPNRYIIDSTGHILVSGMVYDRGAGEINVGQYTDATNLIGASGAAALYRVKMIRDIGVFDQNYITGYEDSEYSWRAWKRGWKTAYAKRAIIYHKRGQSVNRLLQIDPAFATRLSISAARPCKTHGTRIQKAQFILNMLASAGKSEVGRILGRNKVGSIPYLLSVWEMIAR